jgi:2-hydroxychromene-2-carboxylate isomerase
MKFSVDGVKYEFDMDSLTLDEGEVIEDYAGMTLEEFMRALEATKVRAIRAMVLIAKRRAGEQVEWADLGALDLMSLAMSIVEDNDIDLAKASNGLDPAAVEALKKALDTKRKARTRTAKTA